MKGPINNILVYIDGSEESIAAAQYGVVLSNVLQSKLTALYVVNTRALDELLKSKIFLKVEEAEYRRDMEKDAERYLKHVRQLALDKGVTVNTISVNGSVYSEIKKHIREEGIDLLILGEIARIRSRRDELYDETERAMRSAECPVLIVKNTDQVWNLYENYI